MPIPKHSKPKRKQTPGKKYKLNFHMNYFAGHVTPGVGAARIGYENWQKKEDVRRELPIDRYYVTDQSAGRISFPQPTCHKTPPSLCPLWPTLLPPFYHQQQLNCSAYVNATKRQKT